MAVAEDYQRIFEEITSLEVSIRDIAPDHSGAKLAYTRSTDSGLRLTIVDLETLKRTEVPGTSDVTQVYGWSGDDRYLVFLQRTLPPRQDWITVWDSETGEVDRLTADEDVFENSFNWLSGDTYFFVSRPHEGKEQTFWGNLKEGTVRKAPIFIHEDKFVTLSDNRAAFAYTVNIYGFDVAPESSTETGPPPKIVPVTKFSDDAFDALQWLRYSRERKQYLFCARPKDSTWRYLFRYDPKEDTVVQMTDEDTYNGQFLQQGRGFAYVGNRDNSFYLAVRPENPEENADLFTQGSVVSYVASPDGNRLYVHGAQGDEPHGIWEYDLTTTELRPISGVMQQPFEAAEVIAPEELRIPSFDGKEIPAYFFTPPMARERANEAHGLLERRMKYPAVIYIPPNSAQMQRSYGPRSQFLANIGFYFLAVNYRGVDGYGRDYANAYDPETAAKDILAAYDWLIENPNIDQDSIFIFSMSGGTPICQELLATHPKLWRGIAIDKPVAMSVDPRYVPRKMPSLFLITGDQDPAMPSVRRFSDWADEHGVDLDLEIYDNAAHITFDLESRKRSQKEVAEFYIENVR